jgi:luciferase family oxidoreductase group 1
LAPAPILILVRLPLSVLDLSPVTTGTSGAAALRNSIDLARLADRLGYTRYWVAEHHNLPSIASSAPDIMIGQIAAVTQRMRVGSGGVMLPNHAPLMVAERFKVLEALFPGRIDLGLGRAPGTDPSPPMRCVAARTRKGRTTFCNGFRSSFCSSATAFPKDTRSEPCARCPRMFRCLRSGCSDRAGTVRSSPA